MAASKGQTPKLTIKAKISATKADISGLNKQVKSIANQIEPIKLKIDFDESDSKNAVEKLRKTMQSLKSEMANFTSNFGSFGDGTAKDAAQFVGEANSATAAIKELTDAVTNLKRKGSGGGGGGGTANLTKGLANATGQVESLKNQILTLEKKNPVFLQAYGTQVTTLKNDVSDLLVTLKGFTPETISAEKLGGFTDKYAEFQATFKGLKLLMTESGKLGAGDSGDITDFTKKLATATSQVETLQNQLLSFEKKNPVFLQEYGVQVTNLKNKVGELLTNLKGANVKSITQQDLDKWTKECSVYQAELKGLKLQMEETGKSGDTLGGKLQSAIDKFGRWTLVTKLVMGTVHQLKRMYQNVKNLDAAMTELKKVTEETSAGYDQFLTRATKRAKELGSTLTDTVTATADYARLGYTLSESEDLADASIIYKNVGDGLNDISEASESIISTMKAFNVEASNAMSIVDKYNEIKITCLLAQQCA